MSKKTVDLEDRYALTCPAIQVVGQTPRERDIAMLMSVSVPLRLNYGREFDSIWTEAYNTTNAVARKQEARLAADKAKRLELKKAYTATDSVFIKKFNKDQTECVMYIKGLPEEELQKFYNQVNENLPHFNSVLNGKVRDALVLLGNELILRAALRPVEKPSSLVQTVKELLHVNPEKT